MKTSFLPDFTMGENAFLEIEKFVPKHSKIAIFYGQKAYDEAKQYADKILNTDNYEILAKQCYGKEAYKAVTLFLSLDSVDRVKIVERMETLLDNEKYSVKKGLKNA